MESHFVGTAACKGEARSPVVLYCGFVMEADLQVPVLVNSNCHNKIPQTE